MDKIELLVAFLIMLAAPPIFSFFICFYIGFKLVVKDNEVENNIRNYLREIIE